MPSTPSVSPNSRYGPDPGSESEKEEVETVEDPVWRQSHIQVTIDDTESEEEVEPMEKLGALLVQTEVDWQMDYAAPSDPEEPNGDLGQHSDTSHEDTLQGVDLMDDNVVPLPPSTQSPEAEHVPTVVEPIPVDPGGASRTGQVR